MMHDRILHPSRHLLVADTLTQDDLLQVIKGDALALRIPEFYPPTLCAEVSSRLVDEIVNRGVARGTIYDSNIDSFWNVAHDEALRQRYLDNAGDAMQRMRRVCAPFSSPADLMRVGLDEIWPAGTTLMRLDERPMVFGLSRWWRTGSSALPHQDVLWRELEQNDQSPRQLGQLGLNVHLLCPEVGGEVLLWDRLVTDEEYPSFADVGVSGSYGYPVDRIGPPALVVNPTAGDLIVLDTTKVHAVSKVEVGDRVTISGFAGYWGDGRALTCWS